MGRWSLADLIAARKIILDEAATINENIQETQGPPMDDTLKELDRLRALRVRLSLRIREKLDELYGELKP